MRTFSLEHLSDAVLLRDLSGLVAQHRVTTAELLAHLAEVDACKLYLPQGFSSMHAYCVEVLHFADEVAYKRIQAARAALRFPILFSAVADGRLHLTAVRLLAPHLTPESLDELVQASTHRRAADIEQMLLERFSEPDLLKSTPGALEHATGLKSSSGAAPDEETTGLKSSSRDEPPASEDARQRGDSGPLGPVRLVHQQVVGSSVERIPLKLAVEKSTYDKLEHARALLSHSLPRGELSQIFDRALDALIEKLEKRKFASTTKPGRPGRTQRKRCIPASVRRAVWKRDEGRCSFVGETGRRCNERKFLEFDHVDPVARGGTATVEGIRLRCRGHNQHEAEKVFGADFMRRKRELARNTRQREDGRPIGGLEQLTASGSSP